MGEPRAMDAARYDASTPDRDLVVAFQRGDRAAYDEIYRRNERRVRGICQRMLLNPADAEEASQEVFLRGYQALGRFNGQYQLGAWLARIATNICLDELRSRQRAPDRAEQTPEELDQVTRLTDAPEVEVTERVVLEETLTEIQPLHSRALLMRAVSGLSHVEMAGELSMTTQQVKSLLHRARNSFRRVWQEASGFFLAPLATIRGLATRGRQSDVNGLAGVASPAAAVTVERVATGAVAAVLAVSGMVSPLLGGTGHTWPTQSGMYDSRPNGKDAARAERAGQRPKPATAAPGTAAPEATALDKLADGLAGALKRYEKKKDDGDDGPNDRTLPGGSTLEVFETAHQVEKDGEKQLAAFKDGIGPKSL